METIQALAINNVNRLKRSYYPGRGIVMGLTPSGKEFVQIYWTMGRSENSKNRTLVKEDGCVRTKPIDSTHQIQHEELIIYNVTSQIDNSHIVTNGRQTDTISEYLCKGDSFENALYQWEFENDPPIYTPRVSGIVTLNPYKNICEYKMSIIKAIDQNPKLISHQFFCYKASIAGHGHCIHTYSLSQTCLPFDGEPYWATINEDINDNSEFYWNVLPADKRVGLYVKHINVLSGAIKDRIVLHTAV